MSGATDSSGLYYEDVMTMRICSDSDGIGFCGCGDHERLRELLVRYLCEELIIPPPEIPDVRLHPDVRMLLAYVCNRAGWTEHGTSINSVWLTDTGKAALSDLRARAGGGE